MFFASLFNSLRRRYLNLLLVHPNSREAKDVENHLWMQTSHAFIASYKQRLTALDRAIQNQQRQTQQPQQPAQQGQQATPNRQQQHHGVVEHRKLLQRFQKFLADEEKFWTQLILRIRRLFDLQEAEEALRTVGLLANGHDVEMPDARDAAMHGANGRNHFQFPPEDPGVTFAPATPEERESRLSILTKSLVCLGDIARYRELYNESNGRPRAGHEDGGPSRRGRNRRGGGETATRARNYDKARQCYEQARSLLPHEGNPSHQLAIISFYQKDYFSSIIHYYRSLCVRQPYDTAAENLATVLSKALDVWRQQQQRARRDRERGQELGPRARVEALKESIVVMHAIWRIGLEKGVGKMKSVAPDLPKKIFQQFHSLLHDKHLPIDTIYNVIVLSEAGLWKFRMFRDAGSSAAQSRSTEQTSPPPETSTIVEWRILEHVLDMHRCILEVGKDELQDPLASEGSSDDLAQRISATFRRTLPALRIASKWLVANFSYVAQDKEFIAFQAKEKARGVEIKKEDGHKINKHSRKTIEFWKTYAQFVLLLSQRFPADKLPKPSIPLEEDVELRGFLPLKNLMGEDSQSSPSQRSEARNMVHPNEEQLMRIAGMLEDAKVIAQMENSPIGLFNGRVLLRPEVVIAEDAAHRARPEQSREPRPASPIRRDPTETSKPDTSSESMQPTAMDDDEASETGSQTDDDPLREIFDLVLGDEDDDEEKEEIVWNPRAATSPQISPSLQAAPTTPVKPMMSPTKVSPRSPTQFSARAASFSNSKQVPAPVSAPAPVATTAQDLLSNLMGLKPTKPINPGVMTEPAPVQSSLLFGGERTSHINQPNHSIWAGFQDEQSRPQHSGNGSSLNAGHASPHYQRQYNMVPLHHEQPLQQQPTWPPQFSSQSQERVVGLIPASNSYNHPLPPFHQSNGQQHHRIPSSGINPQLFNAPQASAYSFGHSAPPPPIQRLEQQRPAFTSSTSFTGSSPTLQRPIGSQNHYYSSGNGSYPVQASTMLDHQPHAPQATYMSPMMSQIWGHTR
ncbi:hypothetical protein CVT24_009180 [Panaeolus cyanescens]|uniref:DNA/RNA-binding domain-containing protein n=1 Tax=Panaeolus cyanescens TaxID=181874 RepID=A0A409Y897_9AGAR|nr:hypothetical protein CVT24_009180 [Panaeolus cyanescens]